MTKCIILYGSYSSKTKREKNKENTRIPQPMPKKVMVAVKNTQWLIDDWTSEVEMIENISVNIDKLLKEV